MQGYNMRARVNKIIPFSSVDGPGNRTAIFLQGCNINCLYCHNPETRDKYGDKNITTVTEMSSDEVLEQVKKQIPFVRGITVSGGECMLQYDFLTELFTKAKKLGLSTMIDTNGTIDFAGKQDLLDVTDGVLLDIKAYDSDIHRKITGTGNETVIANARLLATSGRLEEIRCVICPSLYDGKHSVRAIGEMMRDLYKPDSFHFKLISYRPMGVRAEYARMLTPGTDYMNELAGILGELGYEKTIVV